MYNPTERDRKLLAIFSQQFGRTAELVLLAEEAAGLLPENWLFQMLAGVALRQTNKPEEACKYFRQAVAISPKDFETVRQLTEAVAASDSIEVAASEYKAHCQKLGVPANILVAPVLMLRDWAEKNNVPILEAGETEEIPFRNLNVFGHATKEESGVVKSNKPCVVEVKGACIFGKSSIILTADGTAISDTGGHPKYGRSVCFINEQIVFAQQPYQVILNFDGLTTREIEEGIFLSGLGSSAFGHWMPEFLPKLQFLQQHPDFKRLPIIVDAGMPQSHFDHLRRLVDNNLIMINANEALLCERLLAAPPPAFWPYELFPNDIPAPELLALSPRGLSFLRSGIKNDVVKKRSRRLFLGRRKMKWRRLINEKDVADELTKMGFEKIFLEEMTTADQIDILQQADWIVAPNGAALFNLIFANPDVKVLILTQPNLKYFNFLNGPMQSLGYNLLYLRGTQAISEQKAQSDYSVSVEDVRQALAYMGLEQIAA